MKQKLNCILVVEGKSDASLISSLFDVDIVVTNGYTCDTRDLCYLNTVSTILPIVVLTDSDKAGEEIRSRISGVVKSVIDIRVDPKRCNKHGKHGVAECDIGEIKGKLSQFLAKNQDLFVSGLGLSDLAFLNIDKNKREFLCGRLNLGCCNNKTFIKRLNSLGISIEKVEEILKTYGD